MSSQDSAAGSAQPETDALRQDVLTGHFLLKLATEDGLPRHALPALATSLQVRVAHAYVTLSHQAASRWWCCATAATGWLTMLSSTSKTTRVHVQARGLLPKWVQWALTQQPALFNRAFRRLFAQVPPALVLAHIVTRSSRQTGEPGCMPACRCKAFSSKCRNWAGIAGRPADPSCFRRSQRPQPRLKGTRCRPGLWSSSGGRRPAVWPRRRRSRCRCSAPQPAGPPAT